MATPLIVEIIHSIRGKDKVSILGFIYTLNKSSTELKHWVCEKRGLCKARITTNTELGIIRPTNEDDILQSHTHGPDISRIEMLKGYTKIKHLASENIDQSTRSLLAYGVETMHDSSIAKLPKIDSVKRIIRMHKAGQENVGNTGSASEIQIMDKHKVTLKGEPFLLYDSSLGDANRMIIFATTKMLEVLSQSRGWYADGTFKVVPEQFYQLYTIHAEKDGYVFPCVYALVTSKNQGTYSRLLMQLKEIEPNLNPDFIMLDFEKAAINAFEEEFVSVITGCFFHLCQNIYRKIQSAGLSQQYLHDQEFAITMRMLPSLAFVHEDYVIECFQILKSEFPQSAMEIADYFEETYIGKILPDGTRRIPLFPIRFWNMFIRVINNTARTNNFVEGWHNAFQSGILCAHPSFNKLLSYLQREQSIQDANYVKWESGDYPHQSRESVARNERVLNLVLSFENRSYLAYLRGIAYNFTF